MKIQRNTVVSFHCTLFNASGDQLETTKDDNPNVYLHGAGNILPGLEKHLDGKTVGDAFRVSLEAKDAYGLRDPAREQRVPIKHLVFKGRLRPGMLVQINTDQGQRPATVIKAGKFSADLDTNHPLAGRDLAFDIEIVELRNASAEEIAHRHVHGPGGHQH